MLNVEDNSASGAVGEAVSPEIARLNRLAEIAGELGETSIANEVRQLTARVSERRFFIACIGQFKRGKSTLLDALVGDAILPTGVVPVTAVPTVLRYGNQRSARVLADSQWRMIPTAELAQYVSEEFNPENRKRVEGVEVFVPSPLLARGMCLVDTPGIGSVFAGNTETTRQFIPQIDAALLVVGADPPISGEELALIEAVAANTDQILVVLNKIDRVSVAERQQAAAFATRVLEARLKRPIARIYEVSALGRLNRCDEADDWDALAGDLGKLASQCGEAMAHSAAERGLRRFSDAVRRSIDERRRALREPIAVSERRIAALHQTVNQAEQSLRDLSALFSADQMRLSTTLQIRRKEFLRQQLPMAREELARDSRSVGEAFGPARRRELMAIAQAVARRNVLPWLAGEEAQAEQLYSELTRRFVVLVNELLQRMAEEQSAEFAHLPKALEAEQGFRTRSRFYFHEMVTVARPASPLLYGVDILMGAARVHGWFLRDAHRFLDQLLETNAARVQGDVERRVVDSRLLLEAEVRKLLRDVTFIAEQALAQARELMASGSQSVSSEVERFEKIAFGLQTIRDGSSLVHELNNLHPD